MGHIRGRVLLQPLTMAIRDAQPIRKKHDFGLTMLSWSSVGQGRCTYLQICRVSLQPCTYGRGMVGATERGFDGARTSQIQLYLIQIRRSYGAAWVPLAINRVLRAGINEVCTNSNGVKKTAVDFLHNTMSWHRHHGELEEPARRAFRAFGTRLRRKFIGRLRAESGQPRARIWREDRPLGVLRYVRNFFVALQRYCSELPGRLRLREVVPRSCNRC